jgi:hypothetical protein
LYKTGTREELGKMFYVYLLILFYFFVEARIGTRNHVLELGFLKMYVSVIK